MVDAEAVVAAGAATATGVVDVVITVAAPAIFQALLAAGGEAGAVVEDGVGGGGGWQRGAEVELVVDVDVAASLDQVWLAVAKRRDVFLVEGGPNDAHLIDQADKVLLPVPGNLAVGCGTIIGHWARHARARPLPCMSYGAAC